MKNTTAIPASATTAPHSSDEVKAPVPVVTLNASVILKYLVLATVILLLLHVLVIFSYRMEFGLPARDKFYFDRENSLPTFFSSLLLLIAASILSLIALLKRRERDAFTIHWAVLAVIFLALSVDESVSFHELLIEPLRHKFNLTGFLRFPWVIAGGAFLLVFLVSYLRFFVALSRNMKFWFFISGATFVMGAVGFEMIGGYFFTGYNDVSDRSIPYMIVMTIEETLEMTGVMLFILTLLLYLKGYAPKVNLHIK